MDKYTATKLLTEKLVEHFGRLTVCDEGYKKKLLDEAKHAYVVGNYVEVILSRDYSKIWYAKKYGRNDTIEGNTLEEVVQGFIPKETNYLFSSITEKMNDCRVLMMVTPYSIISGKEIEAIKSLFYKTSDAQIRESIHTLDVKDFFELYSIYFDNTPEEFSKLFFSNFGKFKRELLEFFSSLEYDNDKDTRINQFENKFGIQKLNSQLKKFQIDFIFPTDKNYIHKTLIDKLTSLLQQHSPPIDWEDENFLNFVFTLPYEDQNLEINKLFLQKFSHLLDVDTILLKEYQQGKYFKEYFELLDIEKKKEIICLIKQSEIENKEGNVFLWSQGFRKIFLDHTSLYKKDAEEFVDYFQSRTLEEKKIILKDVMESDFVNEEVIDWLNKNESGLIREVGLNG